MCSECFYSNLRFFSIKWRIKSFYKLIFTLFFYSFSIYSVCVVIGVQTFNLKKFALCFFALSFSWGFIRNYLILYFFSPLLNAFTDNQNNKTLVIFVVILFFAENFIFISYDAINFIEMYLIGRLIRKTNAVETFKYSASKFYWIMTLVIFFFSYTLFLLFHLNAGTMTSLFLAYSYASPFVILQAVFLFLFFARMKFENRFVNWCAASSLAIFLIHMHPSVKNIYFNYSDYLYALPAPSHFGILVIVFLSIFVISILIDKIRIIFSDLIFVLFRYLYFMTMPSYLKLKVSYAYNNLGHQLFYDD